MEVPRVTDNPGEAAQLVAGGTPVVLVGHDAAALGRFAASFMPAGSAGGGSAGGRGGSGSAGGRGGQDGSSPVKERGCLLGVLVGDLSDPAVAAAAAEMASELWPWTR
jgi:hypothetical protein